MITCLGQGGGSSNSKQGAVLHCMAAATSTKGRGGRGDHMGLPTLSVSLWRTPPLASVDKQSAGQLQVNSTQHYNGQ